MSYFAIMYTDTAATIEIILSSVASPQTSDETQTFALSVTRTDRDPETTIHPLRHQEQGARPCLAHLVLRKLLELAHDPDAYGIHLTSMLFDDHRVREIYHRARAQAVGRQLNLLLNLPADNPEINSLYWE